MKPEWRVWLRTVISPETNVLVYVTNHGRALYLEEVEQLERYLSFVKDTALPRPVAGDVAPKAESVGEPLPEGSVR